MLALNTMSGHIMPISDRPKVRVSYCLIYTVKHFNAELRACSVNCSMKFM